MSTSQIDVQNNPPPEGDLADVKPGLSPEELAALEPGDTPSGDEVAGGAAVAPDAETTQASPKPEDQPDAGDERNETGDLLVERKVAAGETKRRLEVEVVEGKAYSKPDD